MFQQLLAAAYTLQKQTHPLPVKEARADFLHAHSDAAVTEKVHSIPLLARTPEPLAAAGLPLESALVTAQRDSEPLMPSNDSLLQAEMSAQLPRVLKEIPPPAIVEAPQSKPAQLVSPARHPVPVVTSGSRNRMVRKRFSRNNEFFWKVAAVAAMAALSVLFLAAWIDQPSPLPTGLALPSEVLQQQVPFRKAQRVATAQPRSGRVSTRTFVTEPSEAAKSGSTEPTAVVDEPPERNVTPAQKTIASPNYHSTNDSEADLVAPDTVVRYRTRPDASLAQADKKP